MIDPATLAVKETRFYALKVKGDAMQLADFALNVFPDLFAEIWRLREAHDETRGLVRDLTIVLEKRNRDLAAHRAVIRELAGVLEHAYTAEMAWGAQKSKALAHPLVAAARKGTA